MKIRAQLVLACFLLSVLPLSVIVIYSYRSSRSALEAAYRKEADARTRQMDRRLATIRGDLQQRLAEVSALPMPAGATDRTPDVGNILMTMGDAASLVDSLEIQPMRAVMPQVRTIVQQAIGHALPANPNAPPGVQQPPAPTPPPAAEAADAADEADAEAAPESPEPVIIAIPAPPPLPKFTMSPEQRAQINEIAMLGSKLGMSAQTLPPEERTATEKRIQQLQKDLNASLKATQSQWKEQFDAAQKVREEYFQARQQQRETSLAARQKAREIERANRDAMKKQAEAPDAAPATTTEAVVIKHKLTDAEKEHIRQHERQATLLFGQKFNVPLRKEGAIVGQISAQVSTPEVVRRVLGVHGDDADEITFAIDRDNNVYTRNPDDRKTLDSAGITERVLKNRPL
ncbi:MAG TPA: hypothetical protein VGQ46_23465, partial [Thermoanaerobaculia bacterium]|nr:hypothetical protein [Thermoanaerobaculia bacterium]